MSAHAPTSRLPLDPANERVLLYTLAGIQFAHILDFMIIAPLGAIVMPALQIGPQQFATVVSAYAFSAGISGFLAAGFADRFDRNIRPARHGEDIVAPSTTTGQFAIGLALT